jgi:hypothetical protein
MKPKGGILRVQVSKLYKLLFPFRAPLLDCAGPHNQTESCAGDVMTTIMERSRSSPASCIAGPGVALSGCSGSRTDIKNDISPYYDDLLMTFTACLILRKTSSNCEYRCMVCIHLLFAFSLGI